MKKCVIITSYIEGNLIELIGDFQPDFILCADGGYDYAEAAGIKPDMLIGDLDSITVPNDPAIQRNFNYRRSWRTSGSHHVQHSTDYRKMPSGGPYQY